MIDIHKHDYLHAEEIDNEDWSYRADCWCKICTNIRERDVTSDRFILSIRFANRTTLQLGRFASHVLAVEAVESLLLFMNLEHTDHSTGYQFKKRIITADSYEILREKSIVQYRTGSKFTVGRQVGGFYAALLIKDSMEES